VTNARRSCVRRLSREMQFSVLGPLEVRDGPEALPLGGPRQRSVLALLLRAAGRSIALDSLVTEIWGEEPPDGAVDSLYTYVSNLRHTLGRSHIVRADGGYRFHQGDDDTVDAADFEAGLLEARRLAGSDPDAAIALIDGSLSAWRGRPYEGFEDLPSIHPEAARIEELRMRGVEDRLDAELRSGRIPEVDDMETLIGDHPYRERLWELLARSLYRAGRQAEALGALGRLRRLLADELGIEPSPSVSRLEEQMLVHDPALEAASATLGNLPAPSTSFIGRSTQLVDLERLITQYRLVTVTGPGGAGKTRLATEAARRVAGSFPDGTWLVDLAQVSVADGVPEALAAVLRLAHPPSIGVVDGLARHLRSRTTLLVLDNCEHVIDAAGKLATRLLSDAAGLRILATSRQPLSRSGEALFHLAGLATSTDEGVIPDGQRLFEARAAAVQPAFAIGPDNRSEITSICRHLDGLPLAIELAAARVDTLSPSEIDRYLADRFTLLGNPREDRPTHRSLQAAIDWSYELLGPADQRSLDRLGVFDGPFSVAAAGSVLEAPSEVATATSLGRLAGASLLQVLPGTTTRYRLLETLRLYARTHLRADGSWPEQVERHDIHYRGRCRALREAFFGRGRTEARMVVESELADYVAAFDRQMADGRFDDAVEMAWPLGHVWLFSGMLADGAERLERLLREPGGEGTRARADALTIASFLLSFAQQYAQAIDWASEAVHIYRSVSDDQGLAYALARAGHFALSVGDAPTAMAQLGESMEICDRIGYEEGAAWPLTLMAQTRLWSGDESDEVRAMLEEGRRRFIATGDPYGQMHANMFIPTAGHRDVGTQLRFARESMELVDRPGADPLIRPSAFHNLAFGEWDAGDRDRAIALNRIAARSALETGATITSGMAFMQAALFASLTGSPERAALLYGAGDRFFTMVKAPFHARSLQPGIDAATAALGATRYDELYARGSEMTIEQATVLVLRE
jgi:predicted ATPase/DNA-binding SARP family transcriptional activator